MLSSHEGAYDTCLRILLGRGYTLSIRGEADASGRPTSSECLWIARKGEYEFRADNPIELLGLCSLHAEIAPSGPPTPRWWVVPGGPILRDMILDAFPDSGGRFA